MSYKNKIIIGNGHGADLYYSTGGNYKKFALQPAVYDLTDQLVDFKFIKIGDTLPSICYEIVEYKDDNNNKRIQVQDKLGFGEVEEIPSAKCENDKADLLIIYDEPDIKMDLFLDAIKEFVTEQTEIVYVMLRYKSNNVWIENSDDILLKHLVENHLDKLTVITNSTVLRRRGFNISEGLSWESTVTDTVWSIKIDNLLRQVADVNNLIIRFESEAVLHFGKTLNDDLVEFQFIPNKIENDIFRSNKGYMPNFDLQFVLPIVSAISKGEDLKSSINKGLQQANAYYNNGYIINENKVTYSTICKTQIEFEKVYLNIDTITNKYNEDWTLIDYAVKLPNEQLCYKVVKYGMKELDAVPSATIESLTTVDKKEIERYRAIKNLMEEYLNTKNVSRPLSIAVFGTPGSGKSFGVSQIAKNLGKGKIEKLEYNLSQMSSEEELMCAFHNIQDVCLDGKVPLVFFDEFDSQRGSQTLGWLKSFLVPMQDSEFNHMGIHPIGKCIFIFAGGVCETFDQFNKMQIATDDSKEEIEKVNLSKQAKLRDFISRLRGYVNIQGPNPNPDIKSDSAYILRRAVLLRSLIERKANDVVDADGLSMDDSIIKALLRVSKYQHGVRSMEAMIDMSMLYGKDYWSKSDLPPTDQLSIHIGNGKHFKELLIVEKLFSSYREEIAESIHGNYRKSLKEQKIQKKKPNNVPWAQLDEQFKESNRNQADSYVDKLLSINCAIELKNENSENFKFSEDEKIFLAKKEHDRWMENKIQNGWKYGLVTDKKSKINEYILPWEKLNDKARSLDIDPIVNMVEILSNVNLGIYRIK